MDHGKAIRDELCKAAGRLGARVAEVGQICSLPRGEIHDALEDLGADRLLLVLVAAWGEWMDDADLLESLKEWNRKPRLQVLPHRYHKQPA